MLDITLGFIGAGNMARSLIGGLIADGFAAQAIHVADPDAQQLGNLRGLFPIHTHTDNTRTLDAVDVLVLAIKPQALHTVAVELRDTVQARRPLIITIAAGVRTDDLQRWLGGDVAIVRAMPNTPALVQSAVTALYANDHVSDTQRSHAESVLRAVGMTLWLTDEQQLDAVTALSGSGPAYFFLIMEALEAAGVRLGLDATSARLLTLQTAFGAAKMALESQEDAACLRARVTSKGGTTEQAVKVLEDGGLRRLLEDAVSAACERSRELALLLGKS
ncbi:MAG: pyrroline-5-carboxylate reductase [Gammaproteobacteria bacterium]